MACCGFALVSLLAVHAAGVEEMSGAAAAAAVGQEVVVVDTVVQVAVAESGVLFLNFGAPYPDETLTAVILNELRDKFPGADGLENKRVRVTGRVVEYKGAPRIMLREPEQLAVLD